MKTYDDKFDLNTQDEHDFVDPFGIEFPTLNYYFQTTHLEDYSDFVTFYNTLKTDEVKQKFRDLFKAVGEVLDIKYVECFTKPINSCQPNPDSSFTQEYQKHEPSGYCLYLKGLVGIKDNYKPIVYTKKSEDEYISEKFIKHLKILTHSIYRKYYLKPKPLKLTPEEEKDFKSAKVCYICEQEFGVYEKTGEIFKVRDHCHFTGKYRGAAHNECNLKCRKPLILPVVFCNLQGYDSHLFIQQLAKVSGDLSCIPSTEEKYISFSKKIKVGEYFPERKEQHRQSNSKFVLLILSSFFKHHLLILFQIFNQQISKI